MRGNHRAGQRAGWRLAACAAGIMGATQVGAQTAPTSAAGTSGPARAGVQQVVVSAAREALTPERVAADVVVIDEATIRASLADSLGDLLRREAGVQLSRAGGPGQGTGVLLRGAAAGQTVVLVDGVRVGSATLGLTALEQLGLEQVERIEVLRGPASSLFGADAIGGVVQVFTRRGQGAPRLELQSAGGGYGSRQASAAASLEQGAWDLAASVSDERSRGVSVLRPGDRYGLYNPDADGYRLESAQARLGWQPAAAQRLALTLLRTQLNAQYDAADYPPPTYAPDPSPDFRNRVRTQVAALEWQADLRPGVRTELRAVSGLDDARVGARAPDRFVTRREALAAQVGLPAGAAGRLTLALEQAQERAESTSYFAPVSRRVSAGVAALAGAAGAWAWQAEARRDDPSDTTGVSTARIGGAWSPAPGWRVRALAGTTFRSPSFNDLHYPSYGVPTLRPERGRSAELGLAWRAGPGRLEASLYRNRVRDLIGYESDRAFCPADPGYDFGCARNVARARLQGLSVSAAVQAGALALRASAEWLQARDEATGARLPRRAAQQSSLQGTWSVAGAMLDAAVLHLGSRPDGGKTLAAETTLDLGARWPIAPGWQLQAKLLNATDTRTEPGRDYQGLGRQAWLGLRATFAAAGPGRR
jgi:vitamin B12 transporter